MTLAIVMARLCGCEHITLRFDCARAQEHMPMFLARRERERGRNRERKRTLVDQRAVEFWKTQIVTNAEAHASKCRVSDDCVASRRDRCRFLMFLAVG